MFANKERNIIKIQLRAKWITLTEEINSINQRMWKQFGDWDNLDVKLVLWREKH